MTVIRPNSVAGINSITVQSGNSLAVHKANGELLRTITGTTGVSTFSSISVGTAYTDNSAAKSINVGVGASIAQHNDNTLTLGTNGDPRFTITSGGNVQIPADTVKLQIGASQDLYLWHNGSTGNSNISNVTGDLFIQGHNGSGTAVNSIAIKNNAGVELNYQASKKLETTSSGISITGDINVGTAATIKSNGNATFSGIVTAASFKGDGSGLSNITSTTINSNANNRIITGSASANTLNGETNFTFDGSSALQLGGGTFFIKNAMSDSNGLKLSQEASDTSQIFNHYSGPLLLGTSNTERFRIGPSGGIGISTDKIRNADFLHIATASLDYTNATEQLMDGGGVCFQTIDNLAATGRAFPGIFWASNTNELGRARAGILGVAANGHDATDIVFLAKYLPGGDGIYPRDERMRITNGGRIGIGTDAPDHKFEVMDAGSSVATSRNGNNAQLLFKSNNVGQAGQFEVSESSGGGVMIFSTKNTSGGVTESFRVNNDQTISTNGAGTPNSSILNLCKDGTTLTCRSFATGGYDSVFFRSANTNVGKIHFNSGGTQYHTSSDYRRKENVVGLTSAITRLKTLKPYRFNFKVDPSVTLDGFFAHEVTTVPEAISGTKDAVATAADVSAGISTYVGEPIYQTIDQSKLVPLLTAALQEAVTKIETLETKVAALEGG